MEVLIPIVNDNSRNIKQMPMIFNGINRNEMTSEHEWFDNENIDTVNAPSIGPRENIGMVYDFKGKVSGFLSYDNACFFTLDLGDKTRVGMFLYEDKKTVYKDISKPSRECKLILFNRHLLIFPICCAFKLVYEDEKVHSLRANLGDEIDFSDKKYKSLSYATEYNNRIFAVDDEDNIRSCALGNFKAWSKYTGVLTDSWASDVFSPGKFKGICTYRDHITLMKRNITYELFGSVPSNFTLIEAFKNGTINDKSICEVAGMLYFVSDSGVYVYSGGTPRLISFKLKENYKDAISFTDGKRLFVSLDNGQRKRTYVYDVDYGIWSCYSNDFYNFYGNVIYGGKSHIVLVSDDNCLYEIGEGKGRVKWSILSKVFDEKMFNKKSIKKLKFKAKMSHGTKLYFYLSLDNKPFKLFTVMSYEGYEVDNIRDFICYIPLRRCKNFRIKIVGEGKALISGEREFIIRSEK